MTERGFVHILLIGLAIIFLVILLLVVMVSGLDRANQQAGGKSLFSADAKISPLLDNLRQKKDELLADQPSASPEKEEPDETPRRPSGTVEERLGDVRGRLEGL